MTILPVPWALAFWILLVNFDEVTHSNDTSNSMNPTDTSTHTVTPTVDGSTSAELITFDIEFKECEYCTYNYDQKTNIGTFNPNNNYLFEKVLDSENGKTIWEAKKGANNISDFAIKIQVDESDANNIKVTIIMGGNNGETKVFAKTNDQWVETSSTRKDSDSGQENKSDNTSVELDIKSKKETEQYKYSTKGTITTFEAKQGYGFNKVKEGTTVIWQAKDDKKYATKVKVDFSSNTVVLTLGNGSTKVFKQTGGFSSKKWTEISSDSAEQN